MARPNFFTETLVAEEPQSMDKYCTSIFPKNPSPVPEFKHKIAILPSNGFVVVVLRPAAKWGYQKGEDGEYLLDCNGEPKVEKPLKFLFRLKDLYLQGYLSSDRWKVFSDVKLQGVISGADIDRYITYLPYDSSYGRDGMQVDFSKLQADQVKLQSLYKVLSNSGRCYSQADKQEALACIAVTCSEATRRRSIYYWMMRIFSKGLLESVDCAESANSTEEQRVDSQSGSPSEAAEESSEGKQPPDHSDQFRTWSNDCAVVRRGLVFKQGISDKDKAEKQEEYKNTLRDVVVVLPTE